MSFAQGPSSASDASFDTLYHRHARWLVGAVRRRGGGEASEDIVQETFLRASAYAPEDLWRHPRALLLRIARSITLNAARDAARKKRDPGEYQPDVSQAAEQEARLVLRQTVLGIPQPYRDTFVLNRFGGMTYAEIAKAQDISVKTVEWRISKALAICSAGLRG